MKALVLIQGVSSKEDYISESVGKSGFDLTPYSKIEIIRTEEFFEKKTPWYIKPFQLLPFTKDWADRFDDLDIFFTSKQGRIGACRMVRFAIQKLQKENFIVDCLAHSLGTIITICAGVNELKQDQNYRDQILMVDRCYLFASPLGMIFPFGGKVREFVRRYIQNFLAKEVIYVYGSKDFISKNYQEEDQGQILNLVTQDKKEVIKVNEGHSLIGQIQKWLLNL